MKILVVAPSLRLGGLENSVSTMTSWLADAGHSLTLVLCYRGERFYELNDKIDVVEPGFSLSARGKVYFYLSWIRFVRHVIKSKRPDVILSYGDYHNSLVKLSSSFLQVPVVVTDRASPGLKFPLYMRLIRSLTYPKCSGVIAQTQRAALVKKELLKKGVKVKIIPNPVRSFEPSQKVDRKKVVLAVARHYHVKGLDRLIKAFSRLDAPEWELHIAGSLGPETQKLEKMVQGLGLSDRTKFLGSVSNMGLLYSSASVFVLPSRSEGFPNALIEAMSLGCPSIAFDINAGPSEIIQHGENGLIVEDGDIQEMSNAILQLIDNEGLRLSMGHNASKLSNDLNLKSIGEKYENFLKSFVVN
ncbi:glycosyltransferase family 4 protein [Halomonas sp. CS7]|uniref:Glycosyltransferase family 4 protein n=1 Tax=Halomonas pelophila TaxID=3151122 RepID=A0ABV1N8H6_9GAMM